MAPSWAPWVSSISITSPAFTLCCFPPVLITAYIGMDLRTIGTVMVPKRTASLGLVREEDAPPLAGGARLRERLQQAGRHALAGHLQQAERTDVEHLRSR